MSCFAGEADSAQDWLLRWRMLKRPRCLRGEDGSNFDRYVQDVIEVQPGVPVLLDKNKMFLRDTALVVADAVPVRVAKYNVTLQEAALWAVRAEHEILGNMMAPRSILHSSRPRSSTCNC